MTKHILFPIALVTIIIVVLGLVVKKYNPAIFNQPQTKTKVDETNSPRVKIGDTEIEVEIADTEEERANGLSGRDSMDENKGMLFVFPKGSNATFWIKDMKFDIDIIWIRNSKVVKIDKNVKAPTPGTPDNKLTLYPSGQAIDYVLEVNAGFADKKGVKVGDAVILSNL